MAKSLNTSGERGLDTASTVSQISKEKSFVVSIPLTRSEIDWLRQQSRRVAEVSSRRSTLRVKG